MAGASQRGARASIARILSTFAAVVALTIGVVAAPPASDPASADSRDAGIVAMADLSKFQPGNIISNAVFFDKSTMTEAQIQTFLQSKMPSCRSGYTCLKDYYDTSRTTSADAMCGAYKGGTRERASRIIYRVAQACGINPRVILVMLQKEQGLILSSAPSSYNYRSAMGQGCPDTAACDTRYYGFFNQVYGGAWQMKRYANPAGTSQFFTWYAPGKTWNVLYHPNKACGTSPVYIANQATANLYYYTPYQPNSAAIKAGYGTGNSCSSYGNRNFFQFFTDWFGSTQTAAAPAATTYKVTGAIATEWKRTGGATGPLGNPTAAAQTVTDPNGNGTAQKFTGGWIHSSTAGTFTSLSPIMVAYSAAGWLRGDLGWPTGQSVCTSGVCTQPFAGGIISYATGKAAVTTLGVSAKAIQTEYAAQGGRNGHLGYPSAAVQVVSAAKGSGLARKYAGGWIHSSAAGTFTTTSKLMTVYSAAGWVRGSLGWPRAAEQQVTDPNGDGRAQSFQGGWIHSSAKGTFASSTTVMTAYSAAGWLRGSLGWPTGAETCTGTACVQTFAGGIISYVKGSAATSDVGVTAAAVKQAASTQTAVTGGLGVPKSGVQVIADPNGSGLSQKWEKGWVHSSGYGTFVSSNAVMQAFTAAKGVRGGLGWPTGVETCSGSVCAQTFDGGVISYIPGKPAVVMLDMGAAEVAAVRAATSPVVGKAAAYVQVIADPKGNGLARKYSGGWIHASARGAFTTSPKIMALYSAAGWLRGWLGWPAAAEQTVTDPNGNGTAQAFDGGWIHSSEKGTFASNKTVMTAYSAAGWVRGKLGWPLSAEVCTGNACVQRFDGGIIAYLKGKAATTRVGITAAAMTNAAANRTVVAGGLGATKSGVQIVADVKTSGLALKFEKGWVHSSSRGTFASSSTIMTAYSAAGWVRGKLGWPTSPETCAVKTCSQTFQGGTISYWKGKAATVRLK